MNHRCQSIAARLSCSRVPSKRALYWAVATVLSVAWLMGGELRGQEDTLHWEDMGRLERDWEFRMTPEEYRRGVDSTGIGGQRQGDFPSQGRSGGERYPFDWEALGQFGGMEGDESNGRISGMVVRPTGGGNHDVYVGACSGGLWKSTNPTLMAVHWQSIGHNLPNPSVRAFAVHPEDPDVIIVGSGDHARSSGSGIYRTTNGGLNWNWISVPLAGESDHYFHVYYLPHDYNIVVAANGNALLRSTDEGLTWAVVPTLDGPTTDLVIHPDNSNILYACSGTPPGAMFKSVDAGVTWDTLNGPGAPLGNEPGGFGMSVMAICRDYPDNLAAVVCLGNNSGLRGIFRSTDGGDSWEDITFLGWVWGAQHHSLAIAIHPSDPEMIFVGSGSMAKTTDGGTTWTADSEPWENSMRRHDDITQLVFHPPNDDWLWICNDGGLYGRDLNSGVTHSFNGDYETGLNCLQMEYVDAERDFYVTGMQDNCVLATTDGGVTWGFHDYAGDGGDVEITDNENYEWWYARGASPWLHVCRSLTGPEYGASGPAEVYMAYFFYNRYSDSVYTFDADSIYSGPASVAVAPTMTSLFALDPFGVGKRGIYGDYVDGGALFVNYWYNSWFNPPISVCEKVGASWTVNTYNLLVADPNPWCMVYTMTASPQNTRECWAGLAGSFGRPKLLHTEDLWLNYTDIGSGTLGPGTFNDYIPHVFAIVVTPFNEDQIFVGTDFGVFRTEDGGESWEPFQTGMPIVRCADLQYLTHTNVGEWDKLVAGTFGYGMWERRLLGPPIIYVDRRNDTPIEDGTLDHPYNTLDEGIAAAPEGAIVAIHADSYPVPVPSHVTKQLRFESYESSALIGVGD